MGLNGAFDPLPLTPIGGSRLRVEDSEDEFQPLPAPEGREPPANHSKFGRCSHRWPYIGRDGALQGYQCRFETAGGKEIRPLRYGIRNGREGWHWKGWADGRPLYGLPDLLMRPTASTLAVEGEKAADAARRLLPEFIVVSPMNGARSPHKSDWTPLAGRDVLIWPDHDEPGRKFAREVAKLAKDAGANTVKIVTVPDGAPEAWDLADPLPEGWSEETIATALAEAVLLDPDGETQGDYRVLHRSRGHEAPGIYRLVEREDKDSGEIVSEWVRFGSRLDVLADTRNGDGEAWGRLLGIHDRDGTVHQYAMPMAMMAGSGEVYRAELLHRGMTIGTHPKARVWLGDYLSTWRPSGKARCVDRIGWHKSAFVLPDRTYGDTGGERVLLQVTGAAPAFASEGSIEGWRQEIAALAVGNSRMVLAISAALAGPLVYLAGEESGGFHFFGASSIGKTVTLHAARSVWGVPLSSWRTTDNAAEALARGACDTLLTLDEIGQAPVHVVEALAYLLGNQRGKARMRRDASARASLTWRLLFLSTGELGLAARLAEGGRRAMAGQAVRVVEIPADAGTGLGIFDTAHDFGSGAALAEHLRLAADRQCGHAGRAFLDRVTAQLDRCRDLVQRARQMFMQAHCSADADGQVQRACGRFALVAAAGELATALGVLPWAQGEAENAAARCFQDWLRQRGGTVPAEIVAGLRQVRLFLEQHGSSRFELAWLTDDHRHVAGEDAEASLRRTINRAGFRRADAENNWIYYVLPEVWAAEICRGFDHRLIARAMVERGWMEAGDGKNLARRVRVPGAGSPRLYSIRAAVLEADADADR